MPAHPPTGMRVTVVMAWTVAHYLGHTKGLGPRSPTDVAGLGFKVAHVFSPVLALFASPILGELPTPRHEEAAPWGHERKGN